MLKINFYNYNTYAFTLLGLSILSIIFEVSYTNKFFWLILLVIAFYIKFLRLKYKNFISAIISIFAIYIQLRLDYYLITKDFFINLLIILIILKFGELKKDKGHYFFNFISVFIAISSLTYGQDFLSSFLSSSIILISIIHLYLLNQQEILTLNFHNFSRIVITSLLVVPVVIIIYLIIPRQEISLSLLSSKKTSLGIPDKISLGSFDKISNSDESIFTYNNNSKKKVKKYFRVKIFDKLDNQKNWISSKNFFLESNHLISPDNLNKKNNYSGRIILQPHNKTWLPIIKNTQIIGNQIVHNNLLNTAYSKIKIKNKKIYNLKNYSGKMILNDKLITAYTELPNTISKDLIRWSLSRQDKNKNKSQYIDAILNEFASGEFFYTLTPKDLGNDYSTFFLKNKEGYCEYYAGTFTILARLANIPTRIVTGYYGGEYNVFGDFYNITQADAHAWVEVWFKDKGWIRIDPTSYIPRENIRESNNLNYLNEQSVIDGDFFISNSIRNILSYMKYLDYKWINSFTQYDEKSRQLFLKEIFEKDNLINLIKNIFFVIVILFSVILIFQILFNKKILYKLLIFKLKKRGLNIKYYHTHQKIFKMLNNKEKIKLNDVFDFYEKHNFYKIDNRILKRLEINLKILIY